MKRIIPFFTLLLLVFVNAHSQKIDYAKLDSAISKADKLIETDSRVFFKNVESMIVYSQGNIIFEKYYNGTCKDSLHQIQSQTKSITGILTGIAIDKGFIKSENEPVASFFPEYFSTDDLLKSGLTIKDLLTMSSGLKWEELALPIDDPGNDNMNMYNSGKYLEYVLSHPMEKKPFTEFKYNSGCPVIIAGIIEKSSNMPLDKFAEEYLFKPLDISDYYWIKDMKGLCHAGGGLFLKPSDMLKIGVMILNKGVWNDKIIVSEDWIHKSTQSYFQTSFDISEYGYFLWIREMQVNAGKTTKVISAEGAGGQRIYIFPEYNLVISFTERNYNTPQVSPLFIRESVLPCFQ